MLKPAPARFDRGYLDAIFSQHCSPPRMRKPTPRPKYRWRYFCTVVEANTKSEARARLKALLYSRCGLPVGAGNALIRLPHKETP